MDEASAEELIEKLEGTGHITQRELKDVVTLLRYLLTKVVILKANQSIPQYDGSDE
jgi:hypothetical protein